MACNEEKKLSILNRLCALKALENKKPKQRRPYLASHCLHLSDANKWREEIMRQIDRKVTDIQNDSLGQHIVRDLNDKINKLFREKSHWEKRILELGGPDYSDHAPMMTDFDGNIVQVPNPSGRGPGYRYFGAAIRLLGVKDLFEKHPELPKRRRTRHDIYKRIDGSYYVYRDEEDEGLEGPAEMKLKLEEWRRWEGISKETRRVAVEKEIVEETERIGEEEEGMKFVAHVPVPDAKEIERMVLERKKIELLSKYSSEELLQEQSECMDMLNIKCP